MGEIMVEVSDEVEREFETRSINLKGFLRKAAESKAFELELEESKRLRRAVLEFLASKSKLTKKDALELGRKLKKGRFEELKGKGAI